MKFILPFSAIALGIFCSFHPLHKTSDNREPLITHHTSLIADTLLYPEETHFKNLQQLTFGGDNAEAYWSFDGKSVVFQRTSAKDGLPCDQIFYGKLPKRGEKFVYKLVSTGKEEQPVHFLQRTTSILFMLQHMNQARLARRCPTGRNTVTATFGLSTAALIFIWQI
jgi:hypothetical protein